MPIRYICVPPAKNEFLRTRATLLERLKDWGDQASWQEFFDLYSNLIYYPIGVNLVAYTSTFLNAVLALPLQFVFVVIVAQNLYTWSALVLGGYVQILVASLAYLAPVLRGGGHVRLSAGFATTRSWLALTATIATDAKPMTRAARNAIRLCRRRTVRRWAWLLA